MTIQTAWDGLSSGDGRFSLLVYPSSRRRKRSGVRRPEAQAARLRTVGDVRVWLWAAVPTTDRPVPEAPHTSASLSENGDSESYVWSCPSFPATLLVTCCAKGFHRHYRLREKLPRGGLKLHHSETPFPGSSPVRQTLSYGKQTLTFC